MNQSALARRTENRVVGDPEIAAQRSLKLFHKELPQRRFVIWPKGRTKFIIDGIHRKKIADELGYKCLEIVRSDLDVEDARIMARALNLARRQLDRVQKRQIIADQLRESPERSARWIAKMLGVDHKTVISVRDELRSVGEIPQLESTVGQDGKCYSLAWAL